MGQKRHPFLVATVVLIVAFIASPTAAFAVRWYVEGVALSGMNPPEVKLEELTTAAGVEFSSMALTVACSEVKDPGGLIKESIEGGATKLVFRGCSIKGAPKENECEVEKGEINTSKMIFRLRLGDQLKIEPSAEPFAVIKLINKGMIPCGELGEYKVKGFIIGVLTTPEQEEVEKTARFNATSGSVLTVTPPALLEETMGFSGKIGFRLNKATGSKKWSAKETC